MRTRDPKYKGVGLLDKAEEEIQISTWIWFSDNELESFSNSQLNVPPTLW